MVLRSSTAVGDRTSRFSREITLWHNFMGDFSLLGMEVGMLRFSWDPR